MFDWLTRFAKKSYERQPGWTIDPWEGSEGAYVELYRSRLEKIARAFAPMIQGVTTRYNKAHKCAELFVPGKQEMLVARIVVWGEVGLPYIAIIQSAELPPSIREMFFSTFPMSVSVMFEDLEPPIRR